MRLVCRSRSAFNGQQADTKLTVVDAAHRERGVDVNIVDDGASVRNNCAFSVDEKKIFMVEMLRVYHGGDGCNPEMAEDRLECVKYTKSCVFM